MLNFPKQTVLAAGLLLAGASGAHAFTLANGTNRMVVNNLGEEYRWNSPLVTYTYDESFLNYFGSNGVVAVEKAMDILNSIPPASTIRTNYPTVDKPVSPSDTNLWNYPVRPDRFHPRAYTDRILDIKSYALAELFGFMGLGSPEDSAFQLEFGAVTLRNWDPISYGPSRYVNGTLLSWVVLGSTNAQPFPIDVTKPIITLAGTADHRSTRLAEGKYLVAPTRDDIGGYRYLYRKDNFNVEGLPPFTYQVVTNEPNLTDPVIFSIDLRWFCKESRTNTTAAFRQFVATNQWWGPVYTNLSTPPLVILKTNVTWELGWTTNVISHLMRDVFYVIDWYGTRRFFEVSDDGLAAAIQFASFVGSFENFDGNVVRGKADPNDDDEIVWSFVDPVPLIPEAWTPVGQPIDPPPLPIIIPLEINPPPTVYVTNKYSTFKPSYDYIFANVITNIHVPADESKVLYRSWEVVTNIVSPPPLQPDPDPPIWSVVGSVPIIPPLPPLTNAIITTTTNYTTTILNDHCPHGEIIILPTTNVAGYHFTDMQFERVNTLTNLLIYSNYVGQVVGSGDVGSGDVFDTLPPWLPGGGVPTAPNEPVQPTIFVGLDAPDAPVQPNFVGVREDEVWDSTNHAYLAYPIVLQTNTMLLGGIDKIRYVRMQGDSLVTMNYSPNRFLEDYRFPSLENQTFTYLIPNTTQAATNAALPSYEYEMDYVVEGVRKTNKFIKFFTRPDIVFSAMNAPPTVTLTNTAPPSVVNNNAINGLQTAGLNGPGVIQASGNIVFVFNKIGNHWDLDPSHFMNEENQEPGWIWGHFDGSMNEPMIFPNSQTIQDLERQVYSGGD